MKEESVSKDLHSEDYRRFIISVLRLFIKTDLWENKYKVLVNQENMELWRRVMVPDNKNDITIREIGKAILKYIFPMYLIKRNVDKPVSVLTNFNLHYMKKERQAEIALKLGLNKWISGNDFSVKTLKQVNSSFFGVLQILGDRIEEGTGNNLVETLVTYVYDNLIRIDPKIGEGDNKSKVGSIFKVFYPEEQKVHIIKGHDGKLTKGELIISTPLLEELRGAGITISDRYEAFGNTNESIERDIYDRIMHQLNLYLKIHDIEEVRMMKTLSSLSEEEREFVLNFAKDSGYKYIIRETPSKGFTRTSQTNFVVGVDYNNEPTILYSIVTNRREYNPTSGRTETVNAKEITMKGFIRKIKLDRERGNVPLQRKVPTSITPTAVKEEETPSTKKPKRLISIQPRSLKKSEILPSATTIIDYYLDHEFNVAYNVEDKITYRSIVTDYVPFDLLIENFDKSLTNDVIVEALTLRLAAHNLGKTQYQDIEYIVQGDKLCSLSIISTNKDIIKSNFVVLKQVQLYFQPFTHIIFIPEFDGFSTITMNYVRNIIEVIKQRPEFKTLIPCISFSFKYPLDGYLNVVDEAGLEESFETYMSIGNEEKTSIIEEERVIVSIYDYDWDIDNLETNDKLREFATFIGINVKDESNHPNVYDVASDVRSLLLFSPKSKFFVGTLFSELEQLKIAVRFDIRCESMHPNIVGTFVDKFVQNVGGGIIPDRICVKPGTQGLSFTTLEVFEKYKILLEIHIDIPSDSSTDMALTKGDFRDSIDLMIQAADPKIEYLRWTLFSDTPLPKNNLVQSYVGEAITKYRLLIGQEDDDQVYADLKHSMQNLIDNTYLPVFREIIVPGIVNPKVKFPKLEDLLYSSDISIEETIKSSGKMSIPQYNKKLKDVTSSAYRDETGRKRSYVHSGTKRSPGLRVEKREIKRVWRGRGRGEEESSTTRGSGRGRGELTRREETTTRGRGRGDSTRQVDSIRKYKRKD